MAYNITYLNQIVADLGGSDTYIYEIDALNAICTLLGITAGHTYKIDALNAIDVNQGGSGGHKYNIEALNSIITLAGETGGYKYEPDAWAVIQQGALLNQNEPEIDTYIEGLTTPLSPEQIGKLNTLVKALKNGLGISTLSDAFDVFYVFAGETAESSLRNIVKNAHHATAVNSPTFTQFEGFKGDGASAYIDTNYTPSTDKIAYSQNSASIGAYIREQNSSANLLVYAGVRTSDKGILLIQESNSNLAYYVNNVGDYYAGADFANKLGLHIANRTISTKMTFHSIQGVSSSSVASNDLLPSIPVYVLARNTYSGPDRFSSVQISLVFVAKGLSTVDISTINTAFEAYMDSNGKGVIA